MSLERRDLLAHILAGLAGSLLTRPTRGHAAEADSKVPERHLRALVSSYPDHLSAIEGDELVWLDGSRMAIMNDLPARSFAAMLKSPTIADQMRQRYPRGWPVPAPGLDDSPGRLRNIAFFAKMYGDCRAGPLPSLAKIVWMPRSAPQTLSATTVNGVAARLERMQPLLEALPDRVKAFLVPSAGTLSCRSVADTGAMSMHAFAAAIDLNVAKSDYWAWHKTYRPSRAPEMPKEIVEIFEDNGFIWGGKWFHYDTMHFEYRPELLAR